MREIEKKYQADDGTEFLNPADAQHHDRLTAVMEKLKDRQDELTRLLAESAKTADGFRFTFSKWAYYRVVAGAFYRYPVVERVSLPMSMNRYEISADNALECRIWMERAGSDGYWIKLRFDELYHDEKNAKLACLAEMQCFEASVIEDVEKFAKELEA